MDAAQALAKSCGLPQLSESMLYAGPPRADILRIILNRLLRPTTLEYILRKLPADDGHELLSQEEQEAHKYTKILALLDVPASIDALRGSGTYEERLAFLRGLLELTAVHHENQVQQQAQQQMQCSSQSVASSLDTDMQQQHQEQHNASAKQSPQPLRQLASAQRSPQPTLRHGQQQQHLGATNAAAKLLEAACDRVGGLTSEAVHLFPSDVLQALKGQLSVPPPDAQQFKRWAESLHDQLPALRQCEQELLQQVQLLDDASWQQQHADTLAALQGFLTSSHQFWATYQQELSVWCQRSQPAQTHGLGQQATMLLARYQRLHTVLQGVATLRSAHTAMSTFTPPLQGLEPQGLQHLAKAARQEAQRLQHNSALLATGRQRLHVCKSDSSYLGAGSRPGCPTTR